MTVVAAACTGNGSDSAPDVTRTDSASVRIVNVPAGVLASLPRWQVAGSAELRIGAVDGPPEYELFLARYPQTLSDGRIVVLNAGTHSVRVFSPDGTYQTEFGRRGEGPGEYREPAALSLLRGDSLMVWDRGVGRATYLNSDGQVFRTRTVNALRLNESFLGSLKDGEFFLRWVWRSGPANQLIVAHVSGERIDTIVSARLPVKEVLAHGRTAWEVAEFTPNAIGATGSEALWWIDGGPFEVAKLARNGQREAVFRFEVQRRAVTPEFFSWYADSIAFKGPWPAEEKPEIRRIMDRRGSADSLPSLDGVAVGRDGRLWLRRYQYPGENEPREWLVVDSIGLPLAFVQLPRTFTPYEFGTDYILGIARDSLDVQYVARYPLIPRQ